MSATIYDVIRQALIDGKISNLQYLDLISMTPPTEGALLSAIKDRGLTYVEELDKPEIHYTGPMELSYSNNFPAENIAAMKQMLDIDNRTFDIEHTPGIGWNIQIADCFDTKEEAEYFIQLLKAFCR